MPSGYFAILAQHSAWANERLYEACEKLSPAEYWCERGSNPGSLHATLNRHLVTDRVWIARIEGRAPPSLAHNQILYADLVGLKVARVAEDEHLRQLVAGLTEPTLDLSLHYIDRRGKRCEMQLRWVLAHLFDAQARCRGEASALLVQAGIPTPCLDLLAFLRRSEGGTRR
jgi:uncharacterized damage-inducible protein DinB